MPSDPDHQRLDTAHDHGPTATTLLDAWYHYQVIEQGRLVATYHSERHSVRSLWDHAAIAACTQAGTHRADPKRPRRRRRCRACPTVWPAEITQADYRDWLDAPPAPAHGDGNAHRTDVKERSTRAIYARRVVKCYRHWHEVGLLPVNPLGRVRVPKMPRGPVRALTRRQVATILADATRRRQLRDRSVLGLVYHGLRRAEVADARAEHLILDPGEELLRVLGKGTDGGKEREVPLHASLVPILTELLTDPATGARRTTGPLIPNWRRPGTHLAPRTITTIVGRASQAAGEHTTPHQWRHAVATHLIDAGADLREVQGLLGHESLATTETYTKGARRRLRGTIGRMPVTCAGHRVAERPSRPSPTVPPPRREPGIRCRGKAARRRCR